MTPMFVSFRAGIPDDSREKNQETGRKIQDNGNKTLISLIHPQDFNCVLKSNKLFDAVTSNRWITWITRKRRFFYQRRPININSTPWDLILSKLLGLWTFNLFQGGGIHCFFEMCVSFVHQNSDTLPWQKSLSRSLESLGPWTIHVMSCHVLWGSYVLLWRVLVGQQIFMFSLMWGAKKHLVISPWTGLHIRVRVLTILHKTDLLVAG